MQLLLLRQGKSKSLGQGAELALSTKGKRQMQRQGAWIASQGLRPHTVLAATNPVAGTSAAKCAKVMAIPEAEILADALLDGNQPEALLQKLRCRAEPDDRRFLLVLAKEALKELLDALGLGEGRRRQPAGTLLHLEWPHHGSAKLLERIEAGDLPTRFPYPQPFAKARVEEWRDRPAYYYRQSAVVPYRRTPKGLEVLLVGSSGRKHWVVPKGIAEPGLQLGESAAKEALEEAGVLGTLSADALGEYAYAKWGASCTCRVYALRVERELADSEWEESHRGRRWLPAAEAAELVREPEIARLIGRLGGALEGLKERL